VVGSCEHGDELLGSIKMWSILAGCVTVDFSRMSLLHGISYLVTAKMYNFLIGKGYMYRSYFAALTVTQFMTLKPRIYNMNNFQRWSSVFHNVHTSELEGYGSIPSGDRVTRVLINHCGHSP
jgi:hypothetical protein